MDQADRETRLARCYALWAAATSFRKYATDPTFAKTARRNQIKANALTAVSETLLVTATIAVGLTMYHLTANVPYAGVVLAIAAAFGADSFLRPTFTTVFGPAIDRLRGLEPKGADQS